ncbi:MAG: SseB family protein [Desulfatitalea sp.]
MSDDNRRNAFEPVNKLEESLLAAQNGEISLTIFMQKLFESAIYVPSTEEVQSDGQGLQPLFYDRRGDSMVAIFTDLSRITEDFKRHANYCLGIAARRFIFGLPKGFGIVINPSHPVGLEISSAGLRSLKRDLEKL